MRRSLQALSRLTTGRGINHCISDAVPPADYPLNPVALGLRFTVTDSTPAGRWTLMSCWVDLKSIESNLSRRNNYVGYSIPSKVSSKILGCKKNLI
jgi:hypothetical protein